MAPEPRYTLSSDERAALRPGIDVDALERLLAKAPPEARGRLLGFFRKGTRAGIVGAADPELDALIREVWAPLDRAGPARPAGPPRPVDLALVSSLPDGAGALVVRPAEGRDVIVLPEAHATTAQLWMARGALERDRAAHGLVPALDRSFTLPPAPPPPGGARHEATARLLEREHGKELEAVRGAPVRELRGVGQARIVEIEPGGGARP
ncbi:MAG TPA: hypothetical protein VHG91_04090 [Longimicrobium sp.]|nr:hypothetical protein [Longimicrobium sp.]